MKKIIITLTALLFSQQLFAACHQHLAVGAPSSSDQQLCREGYSVGYNYQNKVADWVSYHITAASVNGFYKRSNYFKTDQDIPTAYRAISSDYSSTGYDRGHLAPSGTMDFNQNSMKESFLMTNMAPQLPGFNRGGWKGLEDKIRQWANDYNELYVVTGPIWDGSETYIGNGVYIPSKFYKVVLDPAYNEAIAFIIPHRKVSTSELADFITTVDAVEAATNLDFFSSLPNYIEDDMENVIWNMW